MKQLGDSIVNIYKIHNHFPQLVTILTRGKLVSRHRKIQFQGRKHQTQKFKNTCRSAGITFRKIYLILNIKEKCPTLQQVIPKKQNFKRRVVESKLTETNIAPETPGLEDEFRPPARCYVSLGECKQFEVSFSGWIPTEQNGPMFMVDEFMAMFMEVKYVYIYMYIHIYIYTKKPHGNPMGMRSYPSNHDFKKIDVKHTELYISL